MGKPEWGAKHLCLSCGIRYYDMSASPVVCPKCGTEAPSETAAKPRRSRKAKKPAAPVQKAPPAKAELEEDDLEDVETDDEEDEIIEDASELDDESEDVTKVLDTAIEIEEV